MAYRLDDHGARGYALEGITPMPRTTGKRDSDLANADICLDPNLKPMPLKAQTESPLDGRRIQIRGRLHALELARGIAFGTLFSNGGTVEGFADWLFVHRQTFNGQDPLQQARVYANRQQAAKKRGVDFDVDCRARADQKEEASRRVEAIFNAHVAAIKAHWTETIDGAGIVLAIAELWLGRGHCFADAPDGGVLPAPPLRALEGLLTLLEESGPEHLLHKYDWKLAS